MFGLTKIPGLALLCLALVAASSFAAAAEPATPYGWRVTWTSDPATTATVSWNTASAGKSHKLHVVEASSDNRRVVQADSGRYTAGVSQLHYHHVRLTELKPATRYNVTLESDGQQTAEMYFVTAPVDDRPVKFLFGGDSRSGHDARRKMNQMLAQLVQDQPDILALVHGGDYIVSGLSIKQWDQWLRDHELTVGVDGRLLPVVPARGNHDIGQLFNEVFGFPHDDRNYYAINLSPQVRMVTLNTEASAGGDQAKWLADELAQSRKTHRWLLAQYHRPAYPAVKRPSPAKQHWVPLFEMHNVDVVFEADGHALKRTLPIRGDKHDPTAGVVYVGEGGLGVGQRSPRTDRWYLQSPGMAAAVHHVQLVECTEEALKYSAIELGGKVVDRWQTKPRK